MAPLDKLARGAAAQTLLESEFFQALLEEMRAECIATWIAADTVAVREERHSFMSALINLQNKIRSIATTGQLERQRREKIGDVVA